MTLLPALLLLLLLLFSILLLIRSILWHLLSGLFEMVHTATDASALLLSSFSSVGFSFDPVGGSTGHISHGRLFFHDSLSLSVVRVSNGRRVGGRSPMAWKWRWISPWRPSERNRQTEGRKLVPGSIPFPIVNWCMRRVAARQIAADGE